MATASNHGFPGFQLHISLGLQGLQPVKDRAVLAPGCAGAAWDRLDLGDGLACANTPNLRKKRLHPHSVRHSTAVALLKSGVDLSTISHLLGHASPTTTNRYAKVDLEMKRQAIAKVKPVPRKSRTPWSKDRTILDWLESL